MARLREGRANTRPERRPLPARDDRPGPRCRAPAGSSRCAPTRASTATAVVAMCRRLGVRYSITIRQHRSVRALIEAIPEDAWTPIPYWIDGRCRRGRDRLHPVRRPEGCGRRSGSSCAGCRPTPGSQLALFTLYDYHAFITDRDGDDPRRSRPTTAATPRSRTPSATSRRGSASTTCRRAGSPPTAPGWRSR